MCSTTMRNPRPVDCRLQDQHTSAWPCGSLWTICNASMAATVPGSTSMTVISSAKSTSTPCGGGVVVIESAGLMTIVSSSTQVGMLESRKFWVEVGPAGTIWMPIALLAQAWAWLSPAAWGLEVLLPCPRVNRPRSRRLPRLGPVGGSY